MHRQTKFTRITKKTKETVYNRDRCRCVICGRYVPEECASAHLIARSHGGMGIEQNIVTLCHTCHNAYDNSTERAWMRETLTEYMMNHYPDWDESKLIYRKDFER